MDTYDENGMIVPSENSHDGQSTKPGRNGGTLTPWEKGQSGNLSGKPKGTIHFKTLMRRLLEQEVVVSMNGKPIVLTRAEALMLEKYRLATSSPNEAIRLRAIMDIEDRADGRPVPTIPPAPENEDDTFVFYIPNSNSRKRKDE